MFRNISMWCGASPASALLAPSRGDSWPWLTAPKLPSRLDRALAKRVARRSQPHRARCTDLGIEKPSGFQGKEVLMAPALGRAFGLRGATIFVDPVA